MKLLVLLLKASRYLWLSVFLIASLGGCSKLSCLKSSNAPASERVNWVYVRIEYAVPSKSCVYKVQEPCGLANAQCFSWFKQRAARFGANTVVITQSDAGYSSTGDSFVFNGSGGSSSKSNTTIIALADYYFCPADNTSKP